MRKTTLFIALFATVALLACGCDRGDKPTTEIGGKPSALVGDEAEPGAEIIDEIPDDVPPLDVAWTDGADAEASSSVAFHVTNTTDETLAFTVALHAKSHVGEAERALGEATLDPGASASWELEADELSVRSSDVVGVMSVRIRRSVSMPGGWREVTSDLAPRYYVHAAGYDSVQAFTEEALREEHDGVLFSLPIPSSATAESTATDVVGDVWGGAAYADKTKGDSGLFLRDADGNVYGVVTEARLGSGLVPEPTESSSGEGDTSETEVGDE